MVSRQVIVFLDGMDECEEGEEKMIEILENLRRSQNLKFCASSRPSLPLKQYFIDSPKLLLEDLTRHSISKYVNDRLRTNHKVAAYLNRLNPNTDAVEISELSEQVVEKAQGVFLWVNVAVSSILACIPDLDSMEIVRQRLVHLPPELHDLYETIWSDIQQSVYARKATLYVQLVLCRNLSLLELFLAAGDGIQKGWTFQCLNSEVEEICEGCLRFQTQLSVGCRGLLEVVHSKPVYAFGAPFQFEEERPNDLARLAAGTAVTFMHRTAYEFVEIMVSKVGEDRKTSDQELLRLLLAAECNLWLLDPWSRQADLKGIIDAVEYLKHSCFKNTTYSASIDANYLYMLQQFDDEVSARCPESKKDDQYDLFEIAVDFIGAAAEQAILNTCLHISPCTHAALPI